MKKRIVSTIIIIAVMFSTLSSTVEAKIYNYDSLGRVTEEVYENGQKVKYSYDASGNLLTSSMSQLKSISIDSNQYTLAVNGYHQVVLNGMYTDNETIDIAGDAEYKSSNPDVVSVDDFGVVTGLKTGQANITVKYANYTTTCSVNVVSGNAITAVTLNKQQQ